MIRVEKVLGKFLQQNKNIVLHLAEYIESTRFAEQAHERFKAFCRTFYLPDSNSNPWMERREAFSLVVRDVPAYAHIDWSLPNYWESIPLVDKNSIRKNPKGYLNTSFSQDILWVRPTSGTTGPPVNIWFSQLPYFDFQLNSASRILWVAGAMSDEVRKQPIYCLALDDNKGIPDRVWADPLNSRGLTIRLKFDERNTDSSDTLADLLGRYKPAALTLKPNVLRSIVRQVSESNKLSRSDLKLVISSGAPLDNDLRDEAERVLGAPIINAYGLSEFGVVASECCLQNGLHVYNQFLIAEILREDGAIAQEGSGELVLSSTTNDAMPFIRYRTGDICDLRMTSCPCGKSGLTISSLIGRVIPSFIFPDDSEYYPTNLKNLFKLFPLNEFRITQLSYDRLDVELEFLPSCTNRVEQTNMIRAYIEREVGSLVHVTARETQFRLNDKFQRFCTRI